MAKDDLEDFLDQHRVLRQSLPCTWSAFFSRFGTLRPVQLATIPLVLTGDNVLVTAPTAGGKTEAVAAPICERLLGEKWTGLSVIMVTPTRALVNDLYTRLRGPTEEIGIALGRKTADHAISSNLAEQFLITTPESLESLLTFRRKALAHVRALIIDEIHLLNESPRGDQLRWLIRRLSAYLSHVRPAEGGHYQRIALSATVSDPERLAVAYLGSSSNVVRVAGQREIEARVLCVPGDDEVRIQAAVDAMSEFESVRKVLVFVNSRKQVDTGATHFQYGPFSKVPVYGHHGSLSKHEREKVEERFRSDHRAICVATMTLEVGIDIGDVDLVVCMDPPFSLSSFLQRIGRGCRRLNGKTRVLCIARKREGQLLFEAYVEQSRVGIPAAPIPPMRRSVLVQQVLAYLKQVERHRRVAKQFANIFASDSTPSVSPAFIQDVLTDMEATNLLNRKNDVFEPAADGWEFIESNRIYGNISAAPEGVVLIDADTGRQVATVRGCDDRGLQIAGRSYEVLPGGSGSHRLVRSASEHGEAPSYHTHGLPYAFDVGASLSRYLDVPAGQLIVFTVRDRMTIMTWLGRLLNAALACSLRGMGKATTASSLALHLSAIDVPTIVATLRDSVSAMRQTNVLPGFQPERHADLGPYLKHLSETAAQKARRDWLDIDFLEAWVLGISEVVTLEPGDEGLEDFVLLSQM